MQLSHILIQTKTWFQRTIVLAQTNIKNARTRKSILLVIIVCCFLLYLASKYMLPAHRHFHTSQVAGRQKTLSCLDLYLERWNQAMEVSDAVVKEIPESTKENRFFSFTGNGYVGFSAEGETHKFYFLSGKDYYESTFVPVVYPTVRGATSSKRQAIILNVKEGFVQLLSTYILNKSCVAVKEIFNAHRIHKGVFQQEIVIVNGGVLPITVQFTLSKTGKDKIFKTRIAKTKSGETKYHVVEGTLKTDEYEGLFSTGITDFQPYIRIPQKSMNKQSIVSVSSFNITKRMKKKVTIKQRKSIAETDDSILTKKLKANLLDVLSIKAETFLKQHTDAWKDIWKVGVSIASENDPDSPSSLHVNLTEYYLYSMVQLDIQKTEVVLNECFRGPPTIHNAELWVIPSTIKTLYNLKSRWYSLFQHSSCFTKNKTPFSSVRDSIVLSFIGLQYKPYHLQLAMNPLNLRSNISIHQFPLHAFHSKDLLDLQLFVGGKSSEQILYVTCTGKHNPVIYGCSTACEYIVQLGNGHLRFPVHTTDPVTPLFYVSTNKSHLERLGKTEFMKAAKLTAKLAHRSSLEPHHLKLSPKFWLAVVILIVSFHVIVIKMIYNECRKDRGVVRRR